MTENIYRKIKNAIILEHGKDTIVSEDDLETLKEFLEFGKDFSLEAISNLISDYTRKCDICKKLMFEGFVEGDGDNYYCSDECLHTKYTDEEFFGTKEEQEELEEKGYGNTNYWTNWGLSEETEEN